jgi:hypothetical protein
VRVCCLWYAVCGLRSCLRSILCWSEVREGVGWDVEANCGDAPLFFFLAVLFHSIFFWCSESVRSLSSASGLLDAVVNMHLPKENEIVK